MLRLFARSLIASAFVSAITLFASTASAQFFPPTATLFAEDFSNPAEVPIRWQAAAGSWSATSGTYGNTPGATSIAAVQEYPSLEPSESPTSELLYDVFDYRVRMRNPGTSSSHFVGLVYHLQDAANYFEVVFSPVGSAFIRRVTNGVPIVLAASSYLGGGTGVWFDVEMHRDENRGITSVSVNGIAVFLEREHRDFEDGRVGVIAHGVAGRFDKISLSILYGNDDPYRETFDEPFASGWWNPPWRVENGTYNNPAVEATSVSLLPPSIGSLPGQNQSFTFRSRMFNPYNGPANLVGVVFHHEAERDYAEVVFSPTGVVQLNRVLGHARQTLATGSFAAPPRTWFDVKFEMHSLNEISVAVDGEPVFERVQTGDKSAGRFGLITHWAPGRFDNVWHDLGVFNPVSESFSAPLPSSWVRSGQWDTQGGTLNSTAAGNTDVVATQCACWRTDFRYSARLLNQYGASGNLVGLVYNYQSAGLYAGDYYEVVFSPTGIARLNKFIQGTRYVVATATHSIPRNVWFDVEIIRSGLTTTVLVNGTPLFSPTTQGELGAGDIGVVTHWARGRFDNLNVEEYVVR
jgi:hypothetical protein